MKVEGLEFPTLAVEELAKEGEALLRKMLTLVSMGSNYQEVMLTMADGHAWKVSRALGMYSAQFVCPGDGPHMDACLPPEEMTEADIAFLDGGLF